MKNRMRLDMNHPEDVEFSFEIGIKPEFQIDAIKNKEQLVRYKIAVTDKMMEDEIERITRRYGKVDPQTEVTGKEDIIYSAYESCNADGTVTDTIAKLEDTKVVDTFPAKLKEQIMGKKPEDTIVFRPADVCSVKKNCRHS
jgi:trigger factor